MTDRELKKLSRAELLEMLIVQTEEVERLQGELAATQARLADRIMSLEQSGNIAEASIRINGVFEAAQEAANQYLDNIKDLELRTQEECRKRREQTELECLCMVRRAEQEASVFWEEIRDKIQDPYREHEWWYGLMKKLDSRIVNKPQGGFDE